MLTSLSIRNVVLIESLSFSFDKGLCVITGETGAGKSILLDALGLALGQRAESGLVRHGAEQAAVTAEFVLPAAHPVRTLLKEQGIEIDDTLILRRLLTSDGRSRAFVNDEPVGVGLLRDIGESLVEVHGQFDTHGLLDPQMHLYFLDAFGELEDAAANVGQAFSTWKNIEKAAAALAEEVTRSRHEEDFLRHAIRELDEADPKTGEEAMLSERRLILMNSKRLLEAFDAAASSLDGENGADKNIATAQRTLARIADKAAGKLEGVLGNLDRASSELAEATAALQAMLGEFGAGGDSLDEVEERLFVLRDLARKHAVTVDELPAMRADIASRLALVENKEEMLSKMTAEVNAVRDRYAKLATDLSKKRKAAAARLDKAMTRELAPLKLDKAVFNVRVDALNESEWNSKGADSVLFTAAINPGTPPEGINKIASGGELARFMLALRTVLAMSGSAPTLVFDEVDSGIGGAVADAVGERLAQLAKQLQVLVITHSPQVAARGDYHVQIRKSVAKDKAITELITLDKVARTEEIARMLSGAVVTDQARAAAESLLKVKG